MQKITIRPYEGVGHLSFGMTREQIREAAGCPVETFFKTSESALATDAFSAIGIHVDYKPPDICEFIEMFSPSDPVFHGETLLNRTFAEIRDFFLTIDPNMEFDGDGLTSRKFGIAIYAPLAADEPDEPIEAVAVFERGYYDGNVD